ncbi:MAG: hypothetical protein GXY07_19125 [Candidatus Hydrogenedentes bacterium]|nr:hypothetical protein [Candidatus Hydrogenedentota bacterium]
MKTSPLRKVRERFIRLFVVECPSPIDALAGIGEGPIVAAIGKLNGHQCVEYQIKSKVEFETLCKYLGSMNHVEDRSPEITSCLHISTHGDNEGLLLGGDEVLWESLAECLQPFLNVPENHTPSRIIVLSACMAESQKVTKAFEKYARSHDDVTPPQYVFCTTGEVPWDAAAVAWAVFYHLLPQANLEDKKSIQDILTRIASIGLPEFVYFRWDNDRSKYLKYAAKKK